MRRITDSTCIVESRELGREIFEVCAAETANFDDSENLLTVKLDSFVRKVNQQGADTIIRPAWLPHSETIREQIARDEAADEAREAFRQWSQKVKHSMPSTDDFASSVAAAPCKERRS